MRVAELNIYPVKSTRALPLTEAAVEPWGLADDRRWMVVDADGVVVTARVFPRLLSVAATPLGAGRIQLSGPHAAPLDVSATPAAPLANPHAAALDVDATPAARAASPIGSASAMPTGELVPVQVWKSRLDATRPSAAADAWFSKLLDRDVRLVWLDDPTRRPVNPEHGLVSDRVSFADGYPLLLTNTASLRRLNDWIMEDALLRGEPAPDVPLPMRRFRPNVVVDGAEPFAEDGWQRLRIGAVEFRAAKLCDRCVLTTIDPDTLARGPEPIRTLARHRRWDGKVWFGLNIIPDAPGTLHIRAPVEVS